MCASCSLFSSRGYVHIDSLLWCSISKSEFIAPYWLLWVDFHSDFSPQAGGNRLSQLCFHTKSQIHWNGAGRIVAGSEIGCGGSLGCLSTSSLLLWRECMAPGISQAAWQAKASWRVQREQWDYYLLSCGLCFQSQGVRSHVPTASKHQPREGCVLGLSCHSVAGNDNAHNHSSDWHEKSKKSFLWYVSRC